MRALPCASSVWMGICQPCQERASTPISCSAMAQQAGGDLLAGGDHGVVFAGVVQRRQALAPGDQLVGDAGHGGDDDGDLVAGVHLPLHPAGDVADAVEVGDGGAAEFHYDARHEPAGRWGYGRGTHTGARAGEQPDVVAAWAAVAAASPWAGPPRGRRGEDARISTSGPAGDRPRACLATEKYAVRAGGVPPRQACGTARAAGPAGPASAPR